MQAHKRHTIADLEIAWREDERLELINGEIVKRPMAKAEHGGVQGDLRDLLSPLRRKSGGDGWWFMTEISVRYNEHQCPSHDIAGWRKARMPARPQGVVEITPDWVCEIVSSGHEKKDTLRNFNLLMTYKVPYYWLIWSEDEALLAYQLVHGKYLVIESQEHSGKFRIEPFTDIEFALDYLFGKI